MPTAAVQQQLTLWVQRPVLALRPVSAPAHPGPPAAAAAANGADAPTAADHGLAAVR